MAKTKRSSTNKKHAKKRTVLKVRAADRGAAVAQESDSIYILKLVLYLIIGSQWLRITNGSMQIPIPVGLIVGMLFARTERFGFERKIEYAILLLSMFIGFWLPLGLELSL